MAIFTSALLYIEVMELPIVRLNGLSAVRLVAWLVEIDVWIDRFIEKCNIDGVGD